MRLAQIGIISRRRLAPYAFSEVNIATTTNASTIFLGSPSIVRAPDGNLLASLDYFGSGAPKDADGRFNTSAVYRSTDDGATWTKITDITGIFWGTIFTHNSNVYILGTDRQFGGIAIVRSTDNGLTWGTPVTLFVGGTNTTLPNYNCAPTSVIVKDGYIIKAYNNNLPGGGGWAGTHYIFTVACSTSNDLMTPANWIKSNELQFQFSWIDNVAYDVTSEVGVIEPDITEDASGNLKILCRIHQGVDPYSPQKIVNRAVLLDATIDTVTPAMTVAYNSHIYMPGGNVKFTVRRDVATGLFLSLINKNDIKDDKPDQRNELGLAASTDLINWTYVQDIRVEDQALTWYNSADNTAFSYVDWIFDGNDILAGIRTAYGSAPSYHDTNRIDFYKLANYSNLISGISTTNPPSGNKKMELIATGEKELETSAVTLWRDATDFHNNGANVTAANCPSFVSNRLVFDGVDDFLKVRHQRELCSNAGLTVFAVGTFRNQFRILSKETFNNTTGFNQNAYSFGLSAGIAWNGCFASYSDWSNPNSYIIASKIDTSTANGTIKNFLNGANRGTPTSVSGGTESGGVVTPSTAFNPAVFTHKDPLYIGRRNVDGVSSLYLDADIDYIALYNTALTDQEILDEMARLNGVYSIY